MFIQILVDNKNSWIMEYIPNLLKKIIDLGHNVVLIHESKKVKKGDILFLLSCEQIFKNLELNKHNIVVHESDLPNGKGFSPLTWQILEGKNIIPVSIFEASIKVDSGKVYFKDKILFNGTELVDELRVKQYQITEKLIIKFLKNIDNLPKLKSTLYESYHRKRNPEDSILDVNKTIYEQFNLLRTVDNERYPAFFINNGEQYIVKIYKKDKNER